VRRRRAKASLQRGHEIPKLESFPTTWARNPKAGKLPHSVGTKSQSWKASPQRGQGIPKLESFPTTWARNPKAGKLPHSVGKDSQSWKASPRRGEEIASLRAIKIALFHAAQRIKGWNHVLKKLKKHVSTLFFFISSMF